MRERRRCDWRDTSIAHLPLSGVIVDRLRDAGITILRQVSGTTDEERRAMLFQRGVGLTDGQFHRITSVIAEVRDQDVVRRSHPFGEAA